MNFNKKMLISAVIITFNEEKNIERCLKSLEGVADEIIIVDSFSTDKTEEICKKYTNFFYKNPFIDYSQQKNYANSLTKNDYILSIDADEEISKKLKSSILDQKNKGFEANIYKLNRMTNYCGKWIHYSGWYPDSKIRLWKKGTAEWKGSIHENLVFHSKSDIILLNGDLLHYSYYTIGEHILQANKFTDMSSQSLHNQGKKSNLIKILLKPFFKFIRNYFFKLGILDGYYGFVICSITAFETFLKYIKLQQLNSNSKI